MITKNKNNYLTYASDLEIDIMDSAIIVANWKLYLFTFRVKYFNNDSVYIQICFKFYAILCIVFIFIFIII